MARLTNAMRKAEMLKDAAARHDLARKSPTLEEISVVEFGPALAAILQKRIDRSTRNITEWAEKLTINPSFQFDWSASRFEDAAWVEVCTILSVQAVQWASKNPYKSAADLVDALRKQAMRETLRRASDINRSTSITSNFMNDCLRAVWASVADEDGSSSSLSNAALDAVHTLETSNV